MVRPISTIAVLLLATTGAFSGTEKEKEAMFFAGVALLQQKTDLTPGEKALKFRELESLTGISASQAGVLLERYRERPAEWQKLDDSVMKLLNDTKFDFQKNNVAQAPEKDSGNVVSRKIVKKTPFTSKFKR